MRDHQPLFWHALALGTTIWHLTFTVLWAGHEFALNRIYTSELLLRLLVALLSSSFPALIIGAISAGILVRTPKDRSLLPVRTGLTVLQFTLTLGMFHFQLFGVLPAVIVSSASLLSGYAMERVLRHGSPWEKRILRVWKVGLVPLSLATPLVLLSLWFGRTTIPLKRTSSDGSLQARIIYVDKGAFGYSESIEIAPRHEFFGLFTEHVGYVSRFCQEKKLIWQPDGSLRCGSNMAFYTQSYHGVPLQESP
jgi:hypothetical protein